MRPNGQDRRAVAPTHFKVLIAVACALNAPLAAATIDLVVATDETDVAIGRDLAKFVAPAAGIKLDVRGVPSVFESLRLLHAGKNVKLVILVSDLDQALLRSAVRDADANGGAGLRVVVPLYDEEVHFIARADAPLTYMHDIKDARINVGPPDSGTAEIVGSAYRRMFGKPLSAHQATYLPHEDALIKLVTDKTVDVVAMVAAQPTKLLASMKPDARQYIKLLKLDPNHAAGRAALRAYAPATVRAASYPALLFEDVPALAAKTYLVTLDFRDHATESGLIRFARALCQKLGTLRANGHPKWRDVELQLTPLAGGLEYYQPTSSELRACRPEPRRAPQR